MYGHNNNPVKSHVLIHISSLVPIFILFLLLWYYVGVYSGRQQNYDVILFMCAFSGDNNKNVILLCLLCKVNTIVYGTFINICLVEHNYCYHSNVMSLYGKDREQ